MRFGHARILGATPWLPYNVYFGEYVAYLGSVETIGIKMLNSALSPFHTLLSLLSFHQIMKQIDIHLCSIIEILWKYDKILEYELIHFLENYYYIFHVYWTKSAVLYFRIKKEQ
ncbi:hypothetical protein ACJX0J_034546 [Zea mays]